MKIVSLFDWWRDELSTYIPQRAHALFEQRYNDIRAKISDDQLLLFRDDGSDVRELAAISLSDPMSEQRRQVLPRLFAEQHNKTPLIALALPDDQVLHRRLTFPAAAEDNLRQVIAYEMSRRTPFNSDEVYYDINIVDRAPDEGALTVDLYVVPRCIVDDAVAKLTALGLRPDRVGLSGESGESPPDINFLPQQPPTRLKRLEKLAVAALGVMTAVLLIVAIILPLEQKRDLSVRLTDQVATMRTQVALISRLEQEIAEARKRNRFIADERKASPPAVTVMDDLTKLLPDDTWLFQMHLKESHVSVQGYTNAVSALVELIESSPRFRNVAVQSNITRDQKTGQERFHITFDVAAGGG